MVIGDIMYIVNQRALLLIKEQGNTSFYIPRKQHRRKKFLVGKLGDDMWYFNYVSM